ncbi:tetratricopeptide repeat protein [Micromonospora pisi]|uniref:Tetratricopeptide repeat protein n=1 Tax=Micromonospora pisi TaxID=589240 RepID=A0A495JD30_9ACTN|nr:tetratricopeptide repeat protein [Micromonospora pisi]RKR86641.1 tetratricopeptide repeat protein [Micromonospora pisi]
MTQFGVVPPQPQEASTPIEFIVALRELRLWSGLTFRQLAAKARASGDQLALSTIASALSRSTLPRREVVAGFVRACGLDEESVTAWVAVRDALFSRGGQAAVAGDPDLPGPARDGADTGRQPWPAPQMLPPDIPDFTGRDAEVGTLRQLLRPGPRDGSNSGALVVAAICGMGGVGKTALAVHVAHSLAKAYPDGQLWVDLRDAEASPLEPSDVLARFLRAVGVDSRAIPADPVERAEIYRTMLADRRVLVVLDNASSERQVRPLLPGAGTCGVLLTSRLRLAGLEGAQHVDLEMFSPGESIRLLARIAGDDRLARDVAAAAEIAELCGGLPLAVRVAGARLAARPAWQLADLATLLADERRRLDRLSTGDLAVRASLALSYRELDDEPRQLFHLLALFEVPDFSGWLAATVLDRPPAQATECLEALVDAQLLAVTGTDAAGQIRYHFHDLVRLFAIESGRKALSSDAIAQAVNRGLGSWATLAHRMAPAVPGPCYALISSPEPRPPIDPGITDSLETAPVEWFDAERAALVSAVRQACRLGLDNLAFDLTAGLEKYFDLRGMYTDWSNLNSRVMDLCRDTGNLLGEAVMLRGLLDVTTWTAGERDDDQMARLHDEAIRLLEMFRRLGHEPGRSDAAVMCAWALTAAGRYEEAVDTATRALQLAARSGHLGGQARAYLLLGVANFEHGQFESAAAHAAAALDRARRLGNPRWVATGLQFCGIAHRELGDLDKSRRLLDESLAISRRYRDRYPEVLTLLALARLQLRQNDPAARETAETSLAFSRRYGMNHHMAEALELLGMDELANGTPAGAIVYLEQSVALWRTRGWHSLQAAALTNLGRAYAEVDPPAARRAFQEAYEIFDRLGKAAKAAELRALTGAATPEEPSRR